jgi:ligand-binding sensor domain-containing protein
MRKKKGESLAAPDLSAAWAKYYASTKEDNLAAYESAGWKTLASIAEESGQSLATVNSQMKTLTTQKSFEKKIIRVMCSNGVRGVAIFRPVSQRRANISARR